MEKIILEIQTRGLNQYHRLENFPVTLGRSLDNDIILSDPAVSPHHLRIEQGEGQALYLHNLSRENGTSMNGHAVGEQPVRLPVPSRLVLGNRRLNILSSVAPVAATNLLKFSGFFSVVGSPFWALLLVFLATMNLFANKYLQTFSSEGVWYYLSDVLLNLFVLGVFALVLSLVTWMVSHRWILVSAISMTALLALLRSVISGVGELLSYLFTSPMPLEFLITLYNTVLALLLLYLYQRWASYLRPLPAFGLALLLSSPLLVMEGIAWVDSMTLNGEFSAEPDYDKGLSSFNLHASPSVPLDKFMQQAQEALPPQVE